MISQLCITSGGSFAIGLQTGYIQIYSFNSNTKNYELKEYYKHHCSGVISILYLPKLNFLLSGSYDNIIDVYSFKEKKIIEKLTGHIDFIPSLVSINDTTLAK